MSTIVPVFRKNMVRKEFVEVGDPNILAMGITRVNLSQSQYNDGMASEVNSIHR